MQEAKLFMAILSDPDTVPDWNRPFARPVVAASGLILLATFLSLVALAYLSWSSSARLDPLESHLQHLQNLQGVNLEVQSALIHEVHKERPPDHKDIEKISIRLRDVLRADGYLHRATPDRILAAQNYLLRDGYSVQANLAAAFNVLQQTLEDENWVQRAAIVQSRKAAQREFLIAMFSVTIAPIILLTVLMLYRRRLFAWSARLSQMLENVRNSKLDPVALPEPNDPIYSVIEHYNAMVEKLREIEKMHIGKEVHLERQVQVASESLMRVQRHLAQSEQLSAIGEFSARVAHELRNPLSGIAVALRNLRQDTSDPERIDTLDLVLEELDRISRLLTSLLARAPNERESLLPTSVNVLVRDMVTLFRYENDDNIEVLIDIPEGEWELPRDSLRQAILNVLRNSAQAMGKAGGKITLTGTITDGRLTLVIEDTGPGFPEDILVNGIRAFRTDRSDGSGLGLSILQRLIQNAGGMLKLETAPDGGARTVIELPCRAS